MARPPRARAAAPATPAPRRRIRYQVAMSLDGFIAGPNGEFDWIPMEPDFDFAAHFAQFDTLFMGRKTFELMKHGPKRKQGPFDKTTVVFSKTMDPKIWRHITIVSDVTAASVNALRAALGKDIWLFGGGELFRSLSALGLVDTVEVGVIPIMLGGGVPALPPPSSRVNLQLVRHQAYPKTGMVGLEYEIRR